MGCSSAGNVARCADIDCLPCVKSDAAGGFTGQFKFGLLHKFTLKK